MTTRMSRGIRPGLGPMRAALGQLSVPPGTLGRVMLLAGTNGKGSIAAFAASLLGEAGCKVALYTSPHLLSITERLLLSREPITAAEFDRSTEQALAAERAAGVELTGFELVTLAALAAISRYRPEWSVLEVGLGGRLDATNIITPHLTVISPMGMDHMDFLGTDPASIAYEKAGIVRAGVPCVSARQGPAQLQVVEETCLAVGAPLVLEGDHFSASGDSENWRYSGQNMLAGPLRLGMAGGFQVQNAAVAMAAARLALDDDARLEEVAVAAFSKARWPGRFDVRSPGKAGILFDGAHNALGCRALATAFAARYGHRPLVLFGAKLSKDVDSMLSALEGLASRFIFTRAGPAASHDPARLASLVEVPCEVIPDPEEAFSLLLTRSAGTTNVCCGSLFLVGYCLGLLEEERDGE